jgi:hypothetical protein
MYFCVSNVREEKHIESPYTLQKFFINYKFKTEFFLLILNVDQNERPNPTE